MAKIGDRFTGKRGGEREIRQGPDGGHPRPFPVKGDSSESGCLALILVVVSTLACASWVISTV